MTPPITTYSPIYGLKSPTPIDNLQVPAERRSIAAFWFAALLLLAPARSAETIDIWPADSKAGSAEAEADRPTLGVHLPPRSEGDEAPTPAVLLCPGGGYKHHSSAGVYLPFFQERGIAVFYLKYRLPVKGYQHPMPLLDAQRALSLIRENARKWNIDPARIGVMGFSSGGHLASTLSTHFELERESPIGTANPRPDFAILFSAVITMGEHAHKPSVVRLLGKEPALELVKELSNELQVTAETPPTFLAHADDDRLVLAENSKLYHRALQAAKVPSQLHIYPTGGHMNLHKDNPEWAEQLDAWLRSRKVLPAKKTAEKSTPKPNIIVIMADDLGYGDTSVYDGWVETPQLERMAAGGLTFTDFHTNSSVCSPTRAAFLTGRYQQRVGIVDVVARHLDTPGLSPDQATLPRLLKDAGYRTALQGKWHLGMEPEFNPTHHGFDEFRGYLDGYIDYHNHKKSWLNGLEVEDQPGYSTHLITSNSLRFIEANHDRPFFLMVAHEAVHLPFQTPADTMENRKPIPKGERWSRERIRPKYKIMLEEMDKGIGEILDTLERLGIAKNTLVFFLSDNGAIGAGGNEPFRGGKFSHYEGGHRVPAIAWWPGKIAAGKRSDATAIGTDFLPTALELAGVAPPADRQLDGISLKSHLLEGTGLPQRKLFFGYEPKLGTAMRDGDWKMIIKGDKRELYNLADDIGEKNNLLEQHPERATKMAAEIEKWKREVVPAGS